MSPANLEVSYLGLKLANPVVIGACPMSDRIEVVRRLEDAGAAAVVLQSLFEEHLHGGSVRLPDSASRAYLQSTEAYLAHVREMKRSVAIPVIASINGSESGRWLEVVPALADAGADALEVNTFSVVTTGESPTLAEHRLVDLVARVKSRAGAMPVSVKLSPFYTALPELVDRLAAVGADGLVLFNRFYQADLDIETLQVRPQVRYSDSSDLPLRLRWISVLSCRYAGSLACSGSVHTASDSVKALLSGAHVVQLASAVMRRGPSACSEIVTGLTEWMERHGHADIAEVRDLLNPAHRETTLGAVRADYVRTLRSFDPWAGLR